MAGILTNDENPTMASDDFTFIAHLLYRGTHFHRLSSQYNLVYYIFTPQPQAIIFVLFGWLRYL